MVKEKYLFGSELSVESSSFLSELAGTHMCDTGFGLRYPLRTILANSRILNLSLASLGQLDWVSILIFEGCWTLDTFCEQSVH